MSISQEAVDATKCPKCGDPALDLRNAAFNPDAIRREGQCFWWSRATFTCLERARARRREKFRLPAGFQNFIIGRP